MPQRSQGSGPTPNISPAGAHQCVIGTLPNNSYTQSHIRSIIFFVNVIDCVVGVVVVYSGAVTCSRDTACCEGAIT